MKCNVVIFHSYLFYLVFSIFTFIDGKCHCQTVYEWPLPASVSFTIGAQFHDFQNYGNIPYFHGGIDIRADVGTQIFSPVDGYVRVNSYKISASREPLFFSYKRFSFSSHNIEDDRYIEVTVIDDNGNNWMFRHLDPYSIPNNILNAASNNQKIQKRSVLGSITKWNRVVYPVLELYNHCHLEVVDKDGYYINPALFFKKLPDHNPPVIHNIWIVKNETSEVINSSNDTGVCVTSGSIDIICAITDTIDNCLYRHAPYEINTRLVFIEDNQDEKIISDWTTFVKFDKLPFIGDRTKLATTIYKEYVIINNEKIMSNGADGPRFFLFSVTNGNVKRGYSNKFALHTQMLKKGKYRFDIEAKDISGNSTQSSIYFIVSR